MDFFKYSFVITLKFVSKKQLYVNVLELTEWCKQKQEIENYLEAENKLPSLNFTWPTTQKL